MQAKEYIEVKLSKEAGTPLSNYDLSYEMMENYLVYKAKETRASLIQTLIWVWQEYPGSANDILRRFDEGFSLPYTDRERHDLLRDELNKKMN